jgi:hypothetical protein
MLRIFSICSHRGVLPHLFRISKIPITCPPRVQGILVDDPLLRIGFETVDLSLQLHTNALNIGGSESDFQLPA